MDPKLLFCIRFGLLVAKNIPGIFLIVEEASQSWDSFTFYPQLTITILLCLIFASKFYLVSMKMIVVLQCVSVPLKILQPLKKTSKCCLIARTPTRWWHWCVFDNKNIQELFDSGNSCQVMKGQGKELDEPAPTNKPMVRLYILKHLVCPFLFIF